MTNIPTIDQLEAAGADAGAIMDAARAELEQAIAAAPDKARRAELAQDVKALDRRHREFFGDDK